MSTGPNVSTAPNQPSILFASPMNVLDITSGAALSMRTLLSALAERGFRAVALGATLFDSSFGGEHVVSAGEQQKDKKVLRTNVLGVEHLIVRTEQHLRIKMTSEEEERYMRLFRAELKTRRPDVIITWGGLLLEAALMREAREAGIPVVFYLVSANYKDLETFRYVSAIVTDTQATADVYKERFNFKCHVIGKFIDERLIKAPKHDRKFITFINPSFEKGVNVFMPMARIAAKERPDIKFLVVQSRGRWANALHLFKYDHKEFPNVKIIGHQKDMRGVYAATKALLLPSTWHESGARVIAESLLNHIPVVASHTGGSRELVGEGGLILTLPEAVCEKKGEPADEQTAREWFDVVTRIWDDEAYYQQLVDGARKESSQHDISHNVQRFLRAVSPAIQASKLLPPPVEKPVGEQLRLDAPSKAVPDVIKQALAKKQASAARRSRAKR